jgi:enoyl-CoA hydratase/carnithine racemase
MLMGQILSAQEAKDLGLVSEIHPRDQLLKRAWEIAERLSKKNDLLLRYTRVVLTEPLRKWVEESVVYHLGMEALAKLDKEDVHSDDEELGLVPK